MFWKSYKIQSQIQQHKKVLMKINSSLSTRGRFLIHPSVAPSFINSISIHHAPIMYQVLGQAYTLFLYILTLGNTKAWFRVGFLLACCSMVIPVPCVFKFSCTSSLSVPPPPVAPLPTDFSSTRPPAWTHVWLSRNSRALLQYLAQAVMGEQFVLYQLTSIFNKIPDFAAPYFSFGPQIQHCTSFTTSPNSSHPFLLL